MSSDIGRLQQIRNKKLYSKYIYTNSATWTHPFPGTPIKVTITILGSGGHGGAGAVGANFGTGGRGGESGYLGILSVIVTNDISVYINITYSVYVGSSVVAGGGIGMTYIGPGGANGANGIDNGSLFYGTSYTGLDGEEGISSMFGTGGLGGQSKVTSSQNGGNAVGYGAGGGGGGGGKSDRTAGSGGLGKSGIVIIESWEII